MRIALISDLHIDINGDYPVLEATAAEVSARGADVLIIAGDISENPVKTQAAMERLDALSPCPVYYVPGNHDMWNKNCPDMSTAEIDLFYKADARCLSGREILLEKDGVRLMLAGDIGWYDYSMASPIYTKEQMDAMSMGGRTWQDRFFNQWTGDNGARMQMVLKEMEARLAACGDLPILAVTHMLPVRDFCVPESRPDWGYFNGFLGSTALEDLYRRYPVRYAVCGHVHYRSAVEREGIRYICPCLGYHNEWPLVGLEDNSVERHIRDAMYTLDITRQNC